MGSISTALRELFIQTSVVCISGVFLLAFVTRIDVVQRWDDLMERFAGAHRQAVAPYASIATLAGEPYVHPLIGIGTAAVLLGFRPGMPSRLVIPLATASLGAICLHHAFKLVYRRPRPAIALARGKTEPAFPSGHTANVTAGVLTSAYVLTSQALVAPRVAWGVAIALAIITGLSRVALGWHWASDVIGGWLAGVAVASLSVRLFEWLARNPPSFFH